MKTKQANRTKITLDMSAENIRKAAVEVAELTKTTKPDREILALIAALAGEVHRIALTTDILVDKKMTEQPTLNAAPSAEEWGNVVSQFDTHKAAVRIAELRKKLGSARGMLYSVRAGLEDPHRYDCTPEGERLRARLDAEDITKVLNETVDDGGEWVENPKPRSRDAKRVKRVNWYTVKIGPMYLGGYTYSHRLEHEAEHPNWTRKQCKATPIKNRWLALTLAERWGGRAVRVVEKS